MQNDNDKLSSAGAQRRARMLPLLQDAVRDRVRRKRHRRAVACSLVVFVLIIGLVEVVDRGPIEPSEPGNRLADGGAKTRLLPMTESNAPIVPGLRGVALETGIDIQSFEPSGFYARAIERDPEIFITTPAELSAEFRGGGRSRVVVEYFTRDQLMTELAMSGLDSAVVCSDRDCRLFVGRQ